MALFGSVVFFGFDQRDAMSMCIAAIQAKAAQGDLSQVTCSFLGRDVTVDIPSIIQGG
jgi:tagatose-1,6-bisphosphate aldolase